MKTIVPLLILISALLTGCGGPDLPAVGDPGAAGRPATPEQALSQLREQYAQWRGVPHRVGGISRSGVDCSGFVYLTYRDLFGVELPRTARQQARSGQRVSRKRLTPGDLVFFRTGFSGRHVGIYMQDRQFLHVSERKGVTISSMDESYWRRRYLGGVRVAR